ncbi:MAG TPA: metallophosphoesterase, partial [Flavisolibacter sp.]|nr:metallophosphoesterase [Flavisolibacter sp.]
KIRDRFTIMKEVNKKTVIRIKKGEKATLKASYIGEYNWKGINNKSRTIEVMPSAGITTYTVNDAYGCIQDVFEVHVSS